MSCSIDFSKKAIVLITGSSKGIGKTIAIELAEKMNQNSIFILLARSAQGLEDTKKQMLSVHKSITVQSYPVDLSKADIDTYNDIFKKVSTSIDTSGIEVGLLVHNAGHLGDIKKTTELTNLNTWREYFELNMFSPVLLNSVFIQKIRPITPKLVVVNVTSLCGRVPFENLAMYGAGKGAREIFFKVLALEEPNIIVLNYSPGPVQTDMFDTICRDAESEKVRNNFNEVKEKSILTTEQTVKKLLDILEKGDFKSGDTIDYFDNQ